MLASRTGCCQSWSKISPLWLTSSTRIAPGSRGFVPAPAASSLSSSSTIARLISATVSRGMSEGKTA